MTQLKKKWLGSEQVGSNQILIEKSAAIKAVDSSDEKIDLIKMNGQDEVLLKGIRALTASDIAATVASLSDGKVPVSQLPSIAITDTFVVSTQSAMLELDAQVGDVAIRSDLSKTFILSAAGAGTLANWLELQSPADAVASVNGMVGVVSLTTDDIQEGQFSKYYGEMQFDNSLAQKSTDDLAEGSLNKYYSATLFDSSFSGKSTDDLAEGNALYFTEQRAVEATIVPQTFDPMVDMAPTDKAFSAATFISYFQQFAASVGSPIDQPTTDGNGNTIYPSVYSYINDKVRDSMDGDWTDKAPSVSAVADYVAAQVSAAAVEFKKEVLTLSATDISNQYIDLAFVADTDSLDLYADRLALHEGAGEDYSLSTVSGKTRISFSGDIATGGSSALAAGDKLYAHYVLGA